MLQERYERLKPGDVDGRMTEEEVFADGYASYVSNDGYGMTDAEKKMFEAYEDSVVEQYCEAHPDYIVPAETEAEPNMHPCRYGSLQATARRSQISIFRKIKRGGHPLFLFPIIHAESP